jgi:hypothetical protein
MRKHQRRGKDKQKETEQRTDQNAVHAIAALLHAHGRRLRPLCRRFSQTRRAASAKTGAATFDMLRILTLEMVSAR